MTREQEQLGAQDRERYPAQLVDHWCAGLMQCATCGVEYDANALPKICPICDDERQYLPRDGRQHWVDPARDAAARDCSVTPTAIEPGLYGLDYRGSVGIHQRAKLIVTPTGTIMVDVPAGITAEAVDAVRALGPTLAIVPTHPHMYGLQTAWSRALGDAPVWISRLDASWLGVAAEAVHRFDGLLTLAPGVTAAVLGGHFPGSAVVHFTGEDGAGVMLAGDTIGANRNGTASFMRSFPNYLPLSPAVVHRIARDANRFSFDRLYDNFFSAITHDAGAVVLSSAERYAQWAGGELDHLTGPGLGEGPSQSRGGDV